MRRVWAYRAELVAYQSGPEARMYHLGDAFALRPDEVQGWARERALCVAETLGTGDDAEAFRAWSGEAVRQETRHRLERGEPLFRHHVGRDCAWELTLRPVPVAARENDATRHGTTRREGTRHGMGNG
ncbi:MULTISPECIES: hypothetical protein [unclassified Streptomyces]|uniref:hypothetical protein n=1 Tax=unclassified Streptomyces TaxID=2593676 RepID=UPI0022B68C8C|nr:MULTISPECIES: hypothetical protein [unclassified Streptomyces]MCZ7414845.1 hypothetical protein [Streptomyces sp. WMMC897]MCZ7431789.1 hypothetical protein [Streptomyces sp. WMMC1477]